MNRCVVASSNRGKLAEIASVLSAIDIEWIAQSDLGIVDAEETGATFVENALIKARHACLVSGLPALADDSGLLVDALDGAPGLISAHYAGVHGDSQGNIDRLLSELVDVPESARGACFYSVIVLLRHSEDPQPLIAQGRWRGRILQERRGDGGFGYDPIFFDPALGLGAAELDGTTKNRISHRGQALAQLLTMLHSAQSISARSASSATAALSRQES